MIFGYRIPWFTISVISILLIVLSVPLFSAEAQESEDLGFGKIQGVVYFDDNNNGTKDPGEDGLEISDAVQITHQSGYSAVVNTGLWNYEKGDLPVEPGSGYVITLIKLPPEATGVLSGNPLEATIEYDGQFITGLDFRLSRQRDNSYTPPNFGTCVGRTPGSGDWSNLEFGPHQVFGMGTFVGIDSSYRVGNNHIIQCLFEEDGDCYQTNFWWAGNKDNPQTPPNGWGVLNQDWNLPHNGDPYWVKSRGPYSCTETTEEEPPSNEDCPAIAGVIPVGTFVNFVWDGNLTEAGNPTAPEHIFAIGTVGSEGFKLPFDWRYKGTIGIIPNQGANTASTVQWFYDTSSCQFVTKEVEPEPTETVIPYGGCATQGAVVYDANYQGEQEVWVSYESNEYPERNSHNVTANRTVRGDASQPSISPDLCRVVYIVTDSSGNENLWISELSGGNPRKITDYTGFDLETPYWANDWYIYYTVNGTVTRVVDQFGKVIGSEIRDVSATNGAKYHVTAGELMIFSDGPRDEIKMINTVSGDLINYGAPVYGIPQAWCTSGNCFSYIDVTTNVNIRNADSSIVPAEIVATEYSPNPSLESMEVTENLLYMVARTYSNYELEHGGELSLGPISFKSPQNNSEWKDWDSADIDPNQSVWKAK